MSEQKLNFSRELYTYDSDSKAILDNAVKVTKMAIEKYHSKDAVANISTYSAVNAQEYNDLNALVSKGMIKYAAKVANVPEMFDVNTKEGFKGAIAGFSAFREALFAIQTKVIDTVNSTSEVEQSLLMAEVSNLADGDSNIFDISTKSLFQVEDTGYSNNVSRFQYQFMKPIVLTPRPKEASVAIDLFQLNAIGYDFGKQMAKIAISFRVAMYDNIISLMFNSTPLQTTPFYKATFAKTTFQQLANVVAGANGSGCMAYGTNIALGKASDTIVNNFAFGTSEEYVKTGMVRDLYGVPSMVLRQAVNSNDATYAFKVPDTAILLLTPATDKPVKFVMEGQTFVTLDDGRNNSINLRNYKYKQSWVAQIATQSAYGYQTV